MSYRSGSRHHPGQGRLQAPVQLSRHEVTKCSVCISAQTEHPIHATYTSSTRSMLRIMSGAPVEYHPTTSHAEQTGLVLYRSSSVRVESKQPIQAPANRETCVPYLAAHLTISVSLIQGRSLMVIPRRTEKIFCKLYDVVPNCKYDQEP